MIERSLLFKTVIPEKLFQTLGTGEILALKRIVPLGWNFDFYSLNCRNYNFPKDQKSLSALEMTALLTKVVQEKDREIRQVKAEIETLKEENRKFRELEAKVSALEHLLHSSGK